MEFKLAFYKVLFKLLGIINPDKEQRLYFLYSMFDDFEKYIEYFL